MGPPVNCGLAGRCGSGATVTPSGGIVARPHLELGTHGRIRVYSDPAGYRAVCLYRDWDGVTRQVQRQARPHMPLITDLVIFASAGPCDARTAAR